jgi:predicted MFS family arabinose efflux permease
MGAFLSAGLFGSVLGVALGGVIADRFGWRMAFFVMGAFALVLAAAFRLVVHDRDDCSLQPGSGSASRRLPFGSVMRALFSARTAVYVYVGAGLQMFSVGTMLGWVPSHLNRYHDMDPGEAGLMAGVLVLVSAFGMTLGGAVVDRLSRAVPVRKLSTTAAYAAATALLFAGAFSLHAGPLQLLLIALGLFFSGAHNGPCSAIVTEVNDARLHATVLATYALSASLLGLAAGPLVIGLVADRAGLQSAMLLLPVASLAGCVCLLRGRRHYEGDARRFAAAPERGSPP